ncbi:MAG: biopolymer transporter ExbD [Mameliella sp.]|uniref:ExbD/TolR family protein n=1 Tax=Gilvibacter sp. TaxID=2729997 RepID=UPI0025B8482F|nr:biopolymer transporter ExbD [Gilvibacter sp.]MBV6652685.1 biopolymer transporter ExbD [Phaeodactylibacter sp.]NQX78889.1 biopolymer transporter ExbD [Gilvibacter sp.]NRA49869.1 biopolymer transporter ExbD [Phaeodactylibacter sp.]
MAKTSTRDRMSNEINAGSMADIAFLLLIFFLVTTTIVEDKGITVKLPPWSEEEPDITKLKKRNVFSVLVNAQDQLLVRGEPARVDELRERAKEFINNPNKLENLAEKPTKAIISLKNDRGTSYDAYLTVYNELKAAYSELWDELSQQKYGIPYNDDMPFAYKKAIREEIPFVLSEAEPTAFGEE